MNKVKEIKLNKVINHIKESVEIDLKVHYNELHTSFWSGTLISDIMEERHDMTESEKEWEYQYAERQVKRYWKNDILMSEYSKDGCANIITILNQLI